MFVSIIPTHAKLVIFQRGQFGPAPKPNVYAYQTKRKRSIGSRGLCLSIRQYSVHGKHPADICYSERPHDEWFKYNDCLHSENCMMYLAWASVPLKLFEVDIFSIREANSAWMEELHGSCSLMCSCSEKYRVAVPRLMALQQSSTLCTQSCIMCNP